MLSVSQTSANNLPDGLIVVNFNVGEALRSSMWSKFEVSQLFGRVNERRLDMEWRQNDGRWITRDQIKSEIFRSGDYQIVSAFQSGNTSGRNVNVLFPVKAVQTQGLEDYAAFRAYGNLFIMPGTSLAELFNGYHVDAGDPLEIRRRLAMMEALAVMSEAEVFHPMYVERFYRQIEDNVPDEVFQSKEVLVAAIADLGDRAQVFNPMAWGKRTIKKDYDIEF